MEADAKNVIDADVEVTYKCWDAFYVGNTQNTHKIMEKHAQDVPQRVLYDKNLKSFAVYFTQHFTPKPIPQQCRKIMYFKIIYTVNPIDLMKIWGK